MNFLRKLFSPQHPLDPLRKAVQQRRWADALTEGELAGRQSLPAEEAEERARLLAAAGDALAELNLAEGEAFLRAGDTARAREHFSLAAAQAHHPQLAEKARTWMASSPTVAPSLASPGAAACCSSGCGETNRHDERSGPEELDPQTHLDLLLGSYPKELAERFAGITGPFLRAFIMAHEGKKDESLQAFEQVPHAERDDLFYFERGALLARYGHGDAARSDLERAIALNPQLEAAEQTLVNLGLALGRQEEAEGRLRRMLEKGTNPAFSLGRLAFILAGREERAAALEYALRAVADGADAETCVLAGNLLEEAGRFAEAEACLNRLSGAGCGSLNLPLAEFWLRRQINLEKALQIFKSALRQEPANPRWKLRIAQAYLACGWRKEGLPLLQQALADPHLDTQLQQEAALLIDGKP